MDQFFSKNGLSEEAKLSTLGEVRTIKLNFQTELVKALPTLPPTPHRVLKRLQYICPKKFIESAETESAVIKVAKQIPIIGGNDLRKEIRSFKLEKDKEPNISIDSVWGEVIKDDVSYPVFSKLLEAVL